VKPHSSPVTQTYGPSMPLTLVRPLTLCRSRLIMPNIKRIKCSGVHFAKGSGPLGVFK
jgi:hypothetical protein